MKFIFLVILFFYPLFFYAQTDSITKKIKRIDVHGYVDYLQDVTLLNTWIVNTTLQNRLNVTITPFKNAKIEIGDRNRLLYGDAVKSNPFYANLIEQDNGFMCLSENIASGKSYIFNVSLDRLSFDYTVKKFQCTVGRQRINWGQTFAWNPNDVFNAYSFFDVNYVERKGCDALRLQYFTGVAARGEIAVKLDSRNNTTIAGLYKWTPHKTDEQVLCGYVQDEYANAGAAYSG